MTGEPRTLRILFATPAYWPAVGFGGPIWVTKELAEGLSARGHELRVVTTGIVGRAERPPRRTLEHEVGGVRVTALATPVRRRWIGVTPTLPLELARGPRPDVAHVFGLRDVVGTGVAAWCRLAGVPYLLEPLGMLEPRFRSVRLKRAFDGTLGRLVVGGAALVVATSGLEREEILAAGVPDERIVVRPNGFPPTAAAAGDSSELKERLGLERQTPLLLSVGRLSYKKGLDLLLEALRGLPQAHLAIVGPDDGDGTLARLRRTAATPVLEGRVHFLGPPAGGPPLELYGEADVFVLPSRNENFGIVAAEAAAAGTPVVVTDRCGVAELLRDRAALVVLAEPEAIRAAIARILGDPALRARLAAGGPPIAREFSWQAVVGSEEALLRRVAGGR